MDIGKYLTDSWRLTIKNIGTVLAASIVACVLGTVTFGILAAPLTAGLIVIYLKAAEGHRPKFNDLFGLLRRTLPFLLASIIVAVLVLVGLVLLIIPGLVVMTLMMYVIPLMAHKELGCIAAMKESAAIVNKDGIIMSFLFLVVVIVVGSIGSVAWGVGGLFTFPLALGALAVAYLDRS